MKMTLRRGSALLLAMILLLQSVFTIPMEVHGEAVGEKEFLIRAAHVTDLEKNLTKSMNAGVEYLLALDMKMTLQEGEEKSNLTLALPDFFAPENLTDLEEALQITFENGTLHLSLTGDNSFEGILYIPFKVTGEDKEGSIALDLTDEGYILSFVPAPIEEEKDIEEALSLPEESASMSTVEEDFRFIKIKFTDEAGIEFSAKNPYSIDGKETGEIHFDFELKSGHQVKAGDTMSFPLPKELKPVTATSGNLGDIGTWNVSIDGVVNFIFNKNVDGDDVKGTFRFEVFLDEKEMDEAVEQVIEFEEIYPDFTLKFPVTPKGGTAIDKKGTINTEGWNATEAYWSMDINTALLKMVDPVITDVIPKNMIFKESSLVVRLLEMNAKGERTPGDILHPSLYTLKMDSGNPEITLHLKEEELQKAYRLEYTTTIQEPAEGFSGVQVFKNKANLISDGKMNAAEATVSSGYGDALKKKAPVYDSVKQQLSWEIEYNYNEKAIPKDEAYLKDTWTPAGVMNLVDGSFHVYPVDIDDKGNASPSETPLSNELYKLTYDPGKGFKLEFLQDNKGQAYVIRYKTQLVNTSGDPIITGSDTVNNRVETGERVIIVTGCINALVSRVSGTFIQYISCIA